MGVRQFGDRNQRHPPCRSSRQRWPRASLPCRRQVALGSKPPGAARVRPTGPAGSSCRSRLARPHRPAAVSSLVLHRHGRRTIRGGIRGRRPKGHEHPQQSGDCVGGQVADPSWPTQVAHGLSTVPAVGRASREGLWLPDVHGVAAEPRALGEDIAAGFRRVDLRPRTSAHGALNHPIRVMPSRRRVLEAVDMEYLVDRGRREGR